MGSSMRVFAARPVVAPYQVVNCQRFNRRESNRYSTGWLIFTFLKSECFGFNKKFISLVLNTLGTARAMDFPARTHWSPICIVGYVGGSAFQWGGKLLTGKYSVSL